MSELNSAKSMGDICMLTLCSEIGFLGVNPLHPLQYAEEIMPAISNVIKANKELEHNYRTTTIFCLKHDSTFSEDIRVDITEDLSFGLGILGDMRKAILMSDTPAIGNAVNDPSVGYMIFTIALNKFGELINRNDTYFNILLSLWKTLDEKSPYYERMKSHKLSSLKEKFLLDDARLNQLSQVQQETE